MYVSHSAIGGGLYLAVTEYLAVKRNERAVLDFLRGYSDFLLLLTPCSAP